MKKKIFLTGILAAFIATSATAGIKEKKAMRSADETITAELTKTKTACGGDLAVSVSWDKFKDVITANEEKMKGKNYTAKEVYSQTGERTVGTLQALATICSDPDYKAEITKLKKIVVDPKESIEDYKSEFSLSGDVLTVASGYYMTRTASDFVSPLKALY